MKKHLATGTHKTTIIVVFSYCLFLLTLFISAVSNAQSIQQVISEDSQHGVAIKGAVIAPARVSDNTLVFDLRDINLNPNQALYLSIPTQFHDKTLDFLSITHRQDPYDERDSRRSGKLDTFPGYTSVEVYDLHQPSKDAWRYWGGHGSSSFNSKFAEIRGGTGETDNLYDWQRKGHHSVRTEAHSIGPIAPFLLRVRSIGPDSVRVQKVILKTLPPPPNFFEEVIFSRGLNFGDFATAAGKQYPGNPNFGNYGQALKIGQGRPPHHPSIPQRWQTGNGSIRIPLRPGDVLRAVDIAIGDMHSVPAGADPDNYRGGASLRVTRLRNSQRVENLIDYENIGSSGTMRALPERSDVAAGANEEIEISVSGDVASIMGIRVALKRP